jgi:hypothetical protein
MPRRVCVIMVARSSTVERCQDAPAEAGPAVSGTRRMCLTCSGSWLSRCFLRRRPVAARRSTRAARSSTRSSMSCARAARGDSCRRTSRPGRPCTGTSRAGRTRKSPRRSSPPSASSCGSRKAATANRARDWSTPRRSRVPTPSVPTRVAMTPGSASTAGNGSSSPILWVC